jgi:glycine/D-amino acid oxidase-like deaminating enzyme
LPSTIATPRNRSLCEQIIWIIGYGANGITFGAVAARIVADICLGRSSDDARLFRLDRSP